MWRVPIEPRNDSLTPPPVKMQKMMKKTKKSTKERRKVTKKPELVFVCPNDWSGISMNS